MKPLKMLKVIFLKYKLVIYAVLFAIYTGMVWHVSATYTETKHLQKAVEVAEATIATNKSNELTKNEISKALTETVAKLKQQNTQTNRNIQNEIAKAPVYRDCKSTPDLMHEYQNKLDNQPR